ncbi:hypothetical protein, partial [Colwellia sp. MEBiC06753]
LGLLQCKINNMQMMTMPQRPSYKGNPHLRVRPHVGVIALGNAIGNAIVQGAIQSDYEKRLKQQNEISASLNQAGREISQNIRFEIDTPTFDFSNLVAQGYSYDGGSESVRDVSALVANSTELFNDLEFKQLKLDARTAKVNSFDYSRYKFGGENGVFDQYDLPGVVNEELLSAEINRYFDEHMDFGLSGLNTPMPDSTHESMDTYYSSKEFLTDASMFVGGMSLTANVLSGVEYLPDSRGFNIGFRRQAFDPYFSFGSQYMGRTLEVGSLMDKNFIASANVSTDTMKPLLLAGAKYLTTGANLLTPVVGFAQAYNEAQMSGWNSGETLATGGKAIFDTSLGFLASANPIAAFAAPAYILGDIALSAMGTDWRGAAEIHSQQTERLIKMGMRPAEALNLGPKY